MIPDLGVSVVIPTCGRPELLARCLRALAAQENAGPFEILVMDDAGHPSAAPIVNEASRWFFGGVRIYYLRMAVNAGPAAARNAGWRRASNPVIAFTDDDTMPVPDWISQGLRMIGKHRAVAAAGTVKVPVGPEPTDYERNESRLGQAEFVTANCFVMKWALERIGGFDERFRAAWREDSDLHFRLLALAAETGHPVVRAAAATVIHPVRKAGWGISLRQQRKAYYNALLWKKHPREYRARIQSGPPLLYYASVFAAVLALGAGFAGKAGWTAGCAVAWALCFAVFLRRRLRGTSKSPGHVAEMVITSAVIPFLSVYWRLRGALAFKAWFV